MHANQSKAPEGIGKPHEWVHDCTPVERALFSPHHSGPAHFECLVAPHAGAHAERGLLNAPLISLIPRGFHSINAPCDCLFSVKVATPPPPLFRVGLGLGGTGHHQGNSAPTKDPKMVQFEDLN